ncbi:MAG: TlpA disulfide reductase family protein [Actinomycetota bacterium]
MKLRPRLLVVSLVVALVGSVVVGVLIARSGSSSTPAANDNVRIPTNSQFPTPGIGTNAVVQGTALPKVTVQTLQGDDVATAGLLGHPMVINVWGSTCGPCKRELPDFAKVQAQLGDKVRFVGIDYLPPSNDEEQFARNRGVQYELLYDGNGDFISKVGISAFPVTLFVKSDGTIVKQTGQLDAATLTALINSELL